ncbi:LytR C-terminal domain-containing protein [Candidatus Kaiserbacteria bacterium]|nr:LytR C-terminal domain-containing protein [Candidatus Kaiserbacteria bacterium]USN88654.1 MAG: LytR C-terminal domain-containing protein [Candidatus Nomurabacteria bacterium]
MFVTDTNLTRKIMTSTLNKTSSLLASLLFFCGITFFPFASEAADGSVTLSVSPTLYEMSADPMQVWTSNVRVINPNGFDLDVYARVVNFEAQDETGRASFLPVLDAATTENTLAEWVHLDQDSYTIPAGQTVEIPFQISIPKSAPPGGHFGAIMIGTRPLSNASGQSSVETSQVVTSLIFLRVTGDVVENGSIREFRSSKRLAEKPEMSFELRFENTGNVHVLPQGEIRIFNMWGHERGVIPVNRQTMFGNVLPNSVRKYSFSWSGEWSLADIGRYTAVATLAYGEDGRKFTDAETAFWVLPWKAVGSVLLLICSFFYFLTWAIKLYVRKMLKLAGVTSVMSEQPAEMHQQTKARKQVAEAGNTDTRHILTNGKAKRLSIVAPFEEGMLDLRSRFKNSVTWREYTKQAWFFITAYKTFFIAAVLFAVFVSLAFWFLDSVKEERGFNITIDGIDQNITLSSEQMQYENMRKESPATTQVKMKGTPSITVINRSGVAGLAAEWRLRLEQEGYAVGELRNDLDAAESKTVIVYESSYTDEALVLSELLHGALLSANTNSDAKAEPLIIYIGNDLQNAVE